MIYEQRLSSQRWIKQFGNTPAGFMGYIAVPRKLLNKSHISLDPLRTVLYILHYTIQFAIHPDKHAIAISGYQLISRSHRTAAQSSSPRAVSIRPCRLGLLSVGIGCHLSDIPFANCILFLDNLELGVLTGYALMRRCLGTVVLAGS